jgi:hypothetical protein
MELINVVETKKIKYEFVFKDGEVIVDTFRAFYDGTCIWFEKINSENKWVGVDEEDDKELYQFLDSTLSNWLYK